VNLRTCQGTSHQPSDNDESKTAAGEAGHGQPDGRRPGLKLDWQELPEKKASRILASRPGDFTDETQSQELVEWMVATADNFARVFPHYL
jgi:hypothetical protein